MALHAHSFGAATSNHRGCCPVKSAVPARMRHVICAEKPSSGSSTSTTAPQQRPLGEIGGLGDGLGPIGLSFGASAPERPQPKQRKEAPGSLAQDLAARAGVSLGPIALTYGDDLNGGAFRAPSDSDADEPSSSQRPASIASMTTAEWRAKFERSGTVDVWVEEEFNSGSRIVGGRAVYWGGVAGFLTGEGPSAGSAVRHKVTIRNHYADQVVEVEVPEDRYVLWEAEDAGLELPYACRMGCCTACAVRVVEGEMHQPQALGISAELRERGYALMCVGYPLSDCVLETVPEDEVYDLQFGRAFEAAALNPDSESVERDDYALEIAMLDE